MDRPGYGLSTPVPGRTITDVVADLQVVTDRLEIGGFAVVGVSTGGAYALATAALLPDRVMGVIACCAMTDMRWQPARDTMSYPHVGAVWDAPDREAAITAATAAHGEGGAKMLGGGMEALLCPADVDTFADPTWATDAMTDFPEMFTYGLQATRVTGLPTVAAGSGST